MKNLLPLAFALLLIFTGCKDDDENNTPITTADLLQGTWKVVSGKSEYFDAANTKIHEAASGASDMTMTFAGQNVKILDTGNEFKGTYTISETTGKIFLTTSILGSTKTVEVTKLTEVRMNWQTETVNNTYFDDAEEKTAAKSINTVELVKPR